MKNPTDKQIEAVLGGIIGDGFSRSLGVLVEAGVVDMKKLSKHYKGVGSKYYDLVTEQIALTEGAALMAYGGSFPMTAQHDA